MLEEEVLPSVTEFFSSALRTYPLLSPLRPTAEVCNNAMIPEADRAFGVAADVIVYLFASPDLAFTGKAEHCLQDGEPFMRPLVGSFVLNKEEFFAESTSTQILFMIHEISHVLAFSKTLFPYFVDATGEKYASSQYKTRINYPVRGKTVEAIAFPKMLEKAREAFSCELEGLELEDLDDSEHLGSHWDLRIMPHDIMSTFFTLETIFSDISLAIFEDSGWYMPNYEYSQQIYWGFHQGCTWHDSPCIVDGIAKIPGICTDTEHGAHKCDVFALGHGPCYTEVDEEIPPHEQYFSNSSIGGLGFMDYCPIIISPDAHKCRDSTLFSRVKLGEIHGSGSRCIMSTLLSASYIYDDPAPHGVCHEVISCNDTAALLKVGAVQVACGFGQSISVKGYNGQIQCPESNDFCRPVPCMDMCTGKGKCVQGKCMCNTGFGGDDCSLACIDNCKTCGENEATCSSCYDGYYLIGYSCFECDSNCKTCSENSSLCSSCGEDLELVHGKCEKGCLDHCNSCDNPCTSCDVGFYLYSGNCHACNYLCSSCSGAFDNCLSCIPDHKLLNNSCVPDCLPHCSFCTSPCTICDTGYLPQLGLCESCSNLCASCSESPSNCTSCFPGYIRQNSTCTQGCLANCQSCDEPCTKCEDGFVSLGSECMPCTNNCATCNLAQDYCTSCSYGFELSGGTCKNVCLEHCKTCYYPCTECENGYVSEYGLCNPCEKNCNSCIVESSQCTSCKSGFGLVEKSCVENCQDYCISCNTPCTQCEIGYVAANNGCAKCDEKCASCQGTKENCIKCAAGYVKAEGQCKKGCIHHCSSCDDPCTVCEQGYSPISGICQVCDEGCLTCTGNSTDNCTSCKKGYGLVGNECKLGCADQCTSCDSPCTQCGEGYVAISGVCVQCQGLCKTCSGSAAHCDTCVNGYLMETGGCVKECLPNCDSCDSPCTQCALGFVPVNGVCSVCPEGCGICNPDKKSCSLCNTGYILDGRLCKKDCISHCSTCDTPCTSCESGYLLNFGSCYSCSDECLTCETYSYECTSCRTGYSLSGSSCLPNCLEHCTSCNKPCTVCESGFVPFLGGCAQCASPCATCETVPGLCTSCTSDYQLEGSSCKAICLPFCDSCDKPCTSCSSGHLPLNGECVSCNNYLSPTQVEAKYSGDLTTLIVEFNTELQDLTNDCSLILTVSAAELLGNPLQCIWETSQVLFIALGADSSYAVQSLELLPLVAKRGTCRVRPSGLVVAVHKASLPSPYASIVAPKVYSIPCERDLLIIQGITSEALYHFTVDSNPKAELIEEFVRNTTSKILIIRKDLLKETMLVLDFNVTNKYGVSTVVTSTIDITQDPGLSVAADVGSYLTVYSGKSYVVKPIFYSSRCVQASLNYTWTHFPDTDIEGQAVVQNLQRSYALEIPSGSLVPFKEYTFRLGVSNGGVYAHTDVQVNVVPSDIVVQLDRSSGEISDTGAITISGEKSYDPEDATGSLQYKWTCTTELTPCTDKNNRPLFPYDTDRNVVLRPELLAVPADYVIKLTVSRNNRSASQSITLTTKQAKGSLAVASPAEKINPSAMFVLYPQSSSAEVPSFNWTQVSGPVVPVSNSTRNYLQVAAGTARAGERYSFDVEMSTSNSSITSRVHWRTNAGPLCSGLHVLDNARELLMFVQCSDEDSEDTPLKYVFGVIRKGNKYPMKVQNTGLALLRLPAKNWTVYVDVCDYLNTCVNVMNTAESTYHVLQDAGTSYNLELSHPEALPQTLFLYIDYIVPSGVELVLSHLYGFINTQVISSHYINIAIECLILIAEHQTVGSELHEDLFEFLMGIIEDAKCIEDRVMERLMVLIGLLKVDELFRVQQVLAAYSSKWMWNAPPGTKKELKASLIVLRHRLVENQSLPAYAFPGVNIKQVMLPSEPSKIYDLLFVIYPSTPFPIVGIDYFYVGASESCSITLETPEVLNPEIVHPLVLTYPTQETEDFQCLTSRSIDWVNEGCTILQDSPREIRVNLWHTKLVKVESQGSTQIGYHAAGIGLGMLAVCLALTTGFCIGDRSMKNYMQAQNVREVNEPDSASSPRSLEMKESPEGSPEAKQKRENAFESTDNAGRVRRVTLQLEPEDTAALLFHPSLNLYRPQPGYRRAASVLHLFAVLFAEFCVAGVALNPSVHFTFDRHALFLGITSTQMFISIGGLILVQACSFGLMLLNQVGDLGITKKYLGMCISIVIVVSCFGTTMVLGLAYPYTYTKFWAICFLSYVPVELLVFQNIWWLANYLLFKNKGIAGMLSNTIAFKPISTEAF